MFRSVAPIASSSSNLAGSTFVTTGRIQGFLSSGTESAGLFGFGTAGLLS